VPARNLCSIHSFIHPFILDISITPLQVHYYYSEALPTTALIDTASELTCRSAIRNCEWRTCPRSLRGG